MALRPPVMITIPLAALLLLAACGASDEVSSPTVPAADSTTVAPSTSAPVTTAPATTAPPATAPSTSVAVTTAPPTTAPPTTVAPTSSPPTTAPPTTSPTPPANAPATAFVAVDEQLLEVDVATGDSVRVLDEMFSGIEGVLRGSLRLSPDRSTIWFSEGYEDGWYACETSIGSFGRVDAATGELEILGVGSNPEPSADGELLAYMTSSLCLPDPEQPEFWVLTPSDRVVVRVLATGEELEFVTDTPPDSYDAPSAVLGAGFSPGRSLLVLLGDGRLIDVDIDGSGVIQDHPVAFEEVVGQPVAATADGLITVEFGDEGSTDVFSLGPSSGAPTLLASTGAFLAVGVSADDQLVVSSVDAVTVAPGADVTVVEPAAGGFVYDIDW